MRERAIVALLVLAAGSAAAAIVVTYTTTSTLTTSVTPPPVQFVAGSDAGPSTLSLFVPAYAISSNKTFIATSVKGVPESTVTVDSFAQLENVDTSSRSVTLTTTQVTNAYVTAYTLTVYDGSNALQATLDLRAANPSATVSVPASTMYRVALTLTLASGAGANNVALSNSVTTGVS